LPPVLTGGFLFSTIHGFSQNRYVWLKPI